MIGSKPHVQIRSCADNVRCICAAECRQQRCIGVSSMIHLKQQISLVNHIIICQNLTSCFDCCPGYLRNKREDALSLYLTKFQTVRYNVKNSILSVKLTSEGNTIFLWTRDFWHMEKFRTHWWWVPHDSSVIFLFHIQHTLLKILNIRTKVIRFVQICGPLSYKRKSGWRISSWNGTITLICSGTRYEINYGYIQSSVIGFWNEIF